MEDFVELLPVVAGKEGRVSEDSPLEFVPRRAQMAPLVFRFWMVAWIRILCLRGNPEALLVNQQRGIVSLSPVWMLEV
eukprot:XP_025002260.1 uncharacterized protein LOC107049115 isoform X3 [Gallus gallus]